MKVTDAELMKLIFEQQIVSASTGVLHRYFGGGYGVVEDNDFWLNSAASIHIVAGRHNITDRISSGHLRKRILKLIDGGDLKWDAKGCTFVTSDNEINKKIFNLAREFWLSSGIPTGFDDVNQCMRSKECPELQLMKYSAMDFIGKGFEL